MPKCEHPEHKKINGVDDLEYKGHSIKTEYGNICGGCFTYVFGTKTPNKYSFHR